jgi:hypothetical protein
MNCASGSCCRVMMTTRECPKTDNVRERRRCRPMTIRHVMERPGVADSEELESNQNIKSRGRIEERTHRLHRLFHELRGRAQQAAKFVRRTQKLTSLVGSQIIRRGRRRGEQDFGRHLPQNRRFQRLERYCLSMLQGMLRITDSIAEVYIVPKNKRAAS